MNFENNINIENNNIIEKLLDQSNNNYFNSKNKANPPKKKKNNINNENISNIIYYDENNEKEREIPDIYTDSKLFERIISNGCFILVTNEKKFNLVLHEIQNSNNKKIVNFDLIVSGSKCKKLMKLIKDKKMDIFKSGCIYTTNTEKYKDLENKYDIIENVFTEQDEIISFINEHKSNTNIFKTFKLINFDNYMDKYYNFHKLISEQYKEEFLNDTDKYEFSVALLKDINSSRNLDISSLQNILRSLNNDNRRINIVSEYTDDTIYPFLNTWLNELDFLAYRKISFFIALLMYGLNDIKDEKKGLKRNDKLYRGLKMSYINLSFYERNINNIITLPSFISCSIDENIAKCFCGRIEDEINYPNHFYPLQKRKIEKKFSVLIIIDYKYKEGWEPSAFNICDLSVNKFEKEFILQPFTFYKIQNVEIVFDKYEANIYLENIGKKSILEKDIQNNKIIRYNEKENIMSESKEKEYSEEINKILEKRYPYLFKKKI